MLLQIRVSVDFSTHTATVDAFVTVPILGRVKIASVRGNLKAGIKAEFNVAVAKGFIRLFIEGGLVKLQVNGTFLHRHFDQTVRLVALPSMYALLPLHEHAC